MCARGKGANLLLLLGLPVDSRVLVIGGELEGWHGIFQNGDFQRAWVSMEHHEEEYALVIYHSGSAATRDELDCQLKGIAGLVKGGGTLVFGSNYFSLSALKKLKKGKRIDPSRKVSIGFSRFRQAIEKAGMPVRHKFMVLPSLESGEEFVEHGSRCLELPHHWHPLYHCAQRAGVFRYVADGALHVCLPWPIESGALMQAKIGRASCRERV